MAGAMNPGRPLTPLRAVFLVALVLLGFWISRQEQRPPAQNDEPAAPVAVEQPDEQPNEPEREQPHEPQREQRREPQPEQRPEAPAASPAKDSGKSPTQFPNQSIRDEDGKVVFRGTVDVQPTLDRIDEGRRLSFRNDGSTFQNREGRLPRKPSEYYKEYVHPTPKLSGPGPQRIVVGAEGEAYYTPDHYRTFRRIR